MNTNGLPPGLLVWVPDATDRSLTPVPFSETLSTELSSHGFLPDGDVAIVEPMGPEALHPRAQRRTEPHWVTEDRRISALASSAWQLDRVDLASMLADGTVVFTSWTRNADGTRGAWFPHDPREAPPPATRWSDIAQETSSGPAIAQKGHAPHRGLHRAFVGAQRFDDALAMHEQTVVALEADHGSPVPMDVSLCAAVQLRTIQVLCLELQDFGGSRALLRHAPMGVLGAGATFLVMPFAMTALLEQDSPSQAFALLAGSLGIMAGAFLSTGLFGMRGIERAIYLPMVGLGFLGGLPLAYQWGLEPLVWGSVALGFALSVAAGAVYYRGLDELFERFMTAWLYPAPAASWPTPEELLGLSGVPEEHSEAGGLPGPPEPNHIHRGMYAAALASGVLLYVFGDRLTVAPPLQDRYEPLLSSTLRQLPFLLFVAPSVLYTTAPGDSEGTTTPSGPRRFLGWLGNAVVAVVLGTTLYSMGDAFVADQHFRNGLLVYVGLVVGVGVAVGIGSSLRHQLATAEQGGD